MNKVWAEEKLEKAMMDLNKLKEKEELHGSHPVRVREIEKVAMSVESYGKILKNQNGWSKQKINNLIKKLSV